MRRPPGLLLLLGTSLALLPVTVRADAATEAKLRDALRSTTGQLRALEDERAAWQAKEAALLKEMESLRVQAKASSRPRTSEREVEELKQRLAEQSEAGAKATRALAQCETAREEAARAGEEERRRLAAESSKLAERLAAAEAKNEKIYRVGKELIDWLDREGIGGEPFLGLRRVALENAAQDHEDKLIDQRIKPLGTN
jgi:chromosome segregation ATPase